MRKSHATASDLALFAGSDRMFFADEGWNTLKWVSHPLFILLESKMDKHLITERIANIAAQVAAAKGIEIVHVELAGTKRDAVVRVYVDKDGGVTLDDCSLVSRGIEDVLDTEDLIPSRYVLEVSSPGIERQLYSLSDFVKFTGALAKVKLKKDIDGQKAFVGTILEVEGGQIGFEDRTKGNLTFDYLDVEKANLRIDLSKEFRSKQTEVSTQNIKAKP